MGPTVARHDSTLDRFDKIETGALQTDIQPSLGGLSDDCLHAIGADGGLFSNMRWYRMLEQLDLPAITHGDVELSFAIVSAGGTPIAICPMLRARGKSLYDLYNFRRHYFESWIDHARRFDPELAKNNESSFAFVAGYRRLLEVMKCSLDDFLIVFNPLSLRTQVPIAEVALRRQPEVLAHLLTTLRRFASQEGRPLWVMGVAGETGPMAQALDAAQFQRVFFTHDNRIDMSKFNRFEDYLQSFSSKPRYAMSRDMRRTAQAGVRFRWVEDFGRYAAGFSPLYLNTYTKYETSVLDFTPNVWKDLSESLQSNAQALVAEHDGKLVGFHVFIMSDARREMCGYKIGRRYDCGLDRVPFYFSLGIYEPVRRAIELGYHTYWMGPGAYETKRRRGGEQIPLYNYFWFPRRRDRWMIQPYLERYGESALSEQQKELPVSVRGRNAPNEL